MGLTFLTALLVTSFAALHADELRFAGALGNSDDSQPVFAGKLAAGIGPVLDDQGTLWERGGSTRLNRYALDGRLLASFEIPEGDERGTDTKLRSHWSNQSTGLGDDLPSEIMLTPAPWGEVNIR